MQTMQTKGPCTYCGRALTRSGMARHLGICMKRKERITAAESVSSGNDEQFHIQVRDVSTGWYWLQLEIAGSATMQTLDRYLRAIWLDCCGHSSQWSVGDPWRGRQVSMSAKATAALRAGVELVHVYDFGSSTETRVSIVGRRSGSSTTKRPIALMARNEAPLIECIGCGGPAEWLCMQCVFEEGSSGGLCSAHLKGHPHDDYDEPMPVVNSPRVGVCGYTGPAEPPY
jgi:hypothetical protein